jgi:hypothetical protein
MYVLVVLFVWHVNGASGNDHVVQLGPFNTLGQCETAGNALLKNSVRARHAYCFEAGGKSK